MRLIILSVLIVFPFCATAATPSKILSNGVILSHFGDTDYLRFYDVAYKGAIYRCHTYTGSVSNVVSCTKLTDR